MTQNYNQQFIELLNSGKPSFELWIDLDYLLLESLSSLVPEYDKSFISATSIGSILFCHKKITSAQCDQLNNYQYEKNWIESNPSLIHTLLHKVVYLVSSLLNTNSNLIQDSSVKSFLEDNPFSKIEISANTHFSENKIHITCINPKDETAEFYFISKKDVTYQLHFRNSPKRIFKQLQNAVQSMGYPLSLQALKIKQNETYWECDQFIIQPDYLVDVTAIAECISYAGTHPLRHLLQLFFYEPPSLSILVGTTVNDFLDEQIVNPNVSFDDLFKTVFHKNPLAFCLMSDEQIVDYKAKITQHFYNLKQVLNNKFAQQIPYPKDCLLEPSFYSNVYGIQGRLDIFYRPSDQPEQAVIVELKSGRPFKANKYGINQNHHAQAMLYYYMMQDVFKQTNGIKAFILYSSLQSESMKYAAEDKTLLDEIIYVRNTIYLLHSYLAFPKDNGVFYLNHIKQEHFTSAESFTQSKAELFFKYLNKADELSKSYLNWFSCFIAREQLISKTGRGGITPAYGLSGIWLMSVQEKINRNIILPDLELIRSDIQDGEFPILHFKISDTLNLICSFRKGDTLALYKMNHANDSALHHQIYKCTLIQIQDKIYSVRLRSRQFVAELNDKSWTKHWYLEPDILDRPYTNQFQNLFEFIQSPPHQRQKWLGVMAPDITDKQETIHYTELKEEINAVLQKIISAKDYFLLWGPPGTGKTSILIRYLSHYYIQVKQQNILLLAYTNRAVDEICAALESNGEEWKNKYIRIGSRYAIDGQFQKNLLDEHISHIHTRKDLRRLIENTNIFVATLSSIQGKKEIFLLKSFDVVIIDEASQILESNLIGLVSRFPKTILIGDHMQLPAVCQQQDGETHIKDDALNALGIKYMNQSLFERLFLRCKEQNWDHAYAMLIEQGRMHQDLMKFPALKFYQNKLMVMNHQADGRQMISLRKQFPQSQEEALLKSRTIFIPCTKDVTNVSIKTNEQEAMLIVQLVKKLFEIYTHNNKEWKSDTLGIITPFRAQINKINQLLSQHSLQHVPLTVDTVERYQGGARDIIILSTCISHAKQINQIMSLNVEGLDRKLNVALTRAREQMIIVGHKESLLGSELYRDLIAEYHSL